MRAVGIEQFGGPDVLRDVELPLPEPGPGTVRIRVRAAGFNPVDYKWRQGHISPVLPVVLGRELAGVVDAVGPDVDTLRVGDEVFAYLGSGSSSGAYAEAVCVPACQVARKPARLSFAEAAAIPIAGMTAWVSVVERARVQPGDPVLVAGGAGGVGSTAVALLRHIGAFPLLVTAGSDASAAWLQRLGVRPDHVVRYDGRAVDELSADVRARAGGHGVAAAFDFVGGAMKRLCFDVAAVEGHVASIVEEPPGFALDLWDEATSPLITRSVSFHFVQLGARASLGPASGWAAYGVRLARLAALYEAGTIAPPAVEVVGSLSAATTRAAHARLEAGHVRGKLVMTAG